MQYKEIAARAAVLANIPISLHEFLVDRGLEGGEIVCVFSSCVSLFLVFDEYLSWWYFAVSRINCFVCSIVSTWRGIQRGGLGGGWWWLAGGRGAGGHGPVDMPLDLKPLETS